MMRHFSTVCSLAALAGFISPAVLAASRDAGDSGAVKVELLLQGAPRAQAMVNGALLISVEELARTGNRLTNSGVIFWASAMEKESCRFAGAGLNSTNLSTNSTGQVSTNLAANGEVEYSLSLLGETNSALVTIKSFPGWSGAVPMSNSLTATFDSMASLVDVSAGRTNEQPLKLVFPDGANMLLNADAMARIDFLTNNSYFATGHGNIGAMNADGKEMPMSCYAPPFAGGALMAPATPDGRFSRALPGIDVKVVGALLTNITIEVEDQALPLPPGGQSEISTKNGSSLVIKHDTNTPALLWTIGKGLFRFKVEGISGWQAHGRTGQSGEVQWNASLQLIDLRNLSCEGGVAASLPNDTAVCVEPGATFQYGYENPATFKTAAYGGAVTLYNFVTQKETALEQGSLRFVGGRPILPNNKANNAPPQLITLAWDYGAPCHLSGPVAKQKESKNGSSSDDSENGDGSGANGSGSAGKDGNLSGGGSTASNNNGSGNGNSGQSGKTPSGSAIIQPNSRHVFYVDDKTSYSIEYLEQGDMVVRAIEGNFELRLAAVNGLGIGLPEGNSVSMVLDLKKGTFVIHASESNGGAVSITTADGFAPQLPADFAINFNLGKDGTLLASTSNGKTIFFESAGSGNPNNPNPGGNPTPTVPNDNVDPDRVPQPPVSSVN